MMKTQINIKLEHPESFNGGEHQDIIMHGPKVKHIRSANVDGNQAETEIKLISTLCNLTVSELDEFSIVNYQLLQQKLTENFFSSNGIKTSSAQ